MKETIDFLYDQVRSLQKRVETLEKENAELESALSEAELTMYGLDIIRK